MINVLLYPFKIVWNTAVLALLVWAFIGWWGLIFGSIVAIILLLIFNALDLLFIPLAILVLYRPFLSEYASEEESIITHILGILLTGLLVFIFTMWINSL
jgi:hypothetical protein